MASRATASQRGERACCATVSVRSYLSFLPLARSRRPGSCGRAGSGARPSRRTYPIAEKCSCHRLRPAHLSPLGEVAGGAPSQRGEEEATAVASVSESAAAAAAKAFVNITLRDRVKPGRVTWVGSAVAAAGSKRRQGSRAVAVPLPRRESGERLGRRWGERRDRRRSRSDGAAVIVRQNDSALHWETLSFSRAGE